MEIHLDSEFKITTDSFNYILHQFRLCKNPDTKLESMKWKDIGFYPSLQHSLNGFLRHKGLRASASCVDELVTLLHQIKESIENVPNLLPKDVK